MREIGRFLGIFMYFCDDKQSPAHFHVRYNQHRAVIRVDETAIIAGDLPPRVADLAVEWGVVNSSLLKKNWEAWQQGITVLPRVPPLV